MMNCPRCGLSIEDALTTTCPRCGQSLAETAAESLPDSEVATDALYEAPALASADPPAAGAGVPPGERYDFSLGGPGTLPPPSTLDQSMLPGVPPTPPTSSPPLAPAPAMPQHKSKRGLIIGILLALVVILASALGVSLYALARNQQSASTSRAALSTSTPPMPSPTATPNETVLFQDPLTSNTNGWLTNSNCFFQDQSYHVKGLYLCFAPEGNFSDATISVDVQQVSGPPNWGYGLVLRHASPGNFYEFAITTDGAWDFSKVVNDSRTHLVPFTRTAAIYQGLTMINTLQVRAQGSHFVLFINGIQVGAVDDTTFSIGRTGVVSSGADIEVAFNNFKITTVS